MLRFFLDYYPYAIAAVFLLVLFWVRVSAKAAFFWRALTALIIVTVLAHLNRWFHLYPAHLLFPSGHVTFCLGLSISLGMLRPWTLAITLPLVALLGWGMVFMHYHSVVDVLGAIPLVLIIYGIIHWLWRVPPVVASPRHDN